MTPPSTGTLWPSAPAWFRHRVGDRAHLGAIAARGERTVDLGPLDDAALLRAGGLDAADVTARLARGTCIDPAAIVFDVPIARPGKILCFGKNFAAHAAEFGAAVPEEPIFFTKLPDTLLPHEGTVVLPHWVETRIDHEIELGVVLGFEDPEGRGRKYVDREDALSLVSGWTIINDVTARKMQGEDRGRQQPWLRCKSFDTFCPIGPWVVPKDALDARDLAIDLWVGDDHRQSSRTSLMVVDVPSAIAWLSRHTTLRPGDLIAMGTPEGVGPIRDGDTMVGTVEGIGALRNRVAREPAP